MEGQPFVYAFFIRRNTDEKLTDTGHIRIRATN